MCSWLPLFIADKNLVEILGIFAQDGILHINHQALVNLNQFLHWRTKTSVSWRNLVFCFFVMSFKKTYRNVDEHFVNFSSREKFLQRIQEILEKEELKLKKKPDYSAGNNIHGYSLTWLQERLHKENNSFCMKQGPHCESSGNYCLQKKCCHVQLVLNLFYLSSFERCLVFPVATVIIKLSYDSYHQNITC